MLTEITAIGISLASLHIPHHEQNQFNPGIHLEAHNARMGVYLNSRDRVSTYVGYSIPLSSGQIGATDYRIGLLAALGSGYKSPVYGGVEFRVGERVVVMAVPPVPHYSAGVIGIAYRIPLKE